MCIDILRYYRDSLPKQFSVQQATAVLKPHINGRSMPTTSQLAQLFRMDPMIKAVGMVKEGPGNRKVYQFVE